MDATDLRTLLPSDTVVLARFAGDLHDQRDVEKAAELILAFAVRSIPCDYAGLMLDGRRAVDRVWVSAPWLRRADQLQVDHDDGPYRSRLDGQGGVRVLDTALDGRWPRWSPQLAELGVRSVLCLRVSDGRVAIGTIILYALEPGRFDAREAAMAHMVSRHAAIAIDTAQHEDKLRRAAELRGFIGQAQGILMARFGLDSVQAFAILRRASRECDISVGEAARLLASTGELPANVAEIGA
ncbi:GAF and ANTAR domain-containing protein [Jiangella alkaliphila]|uniref:GAF and ANTAR domain-containing protein n=1 Tax=Jiangella alkaliphila TaxID=419479 RepID=UPI001364C777|nr:GAF and ANTAR domain-containing protein [Jiangella alkaliphila]